MLKTILFANLSMIIVGLITSIIMSSRGYLLKNGYTEEYILAKKKFNLKSGLIQLISFIGIQAITILTIHLIKGNINYDDFHTWVIPITIIFLLSISIFLSVSFNKFFFYLADYTGD